MMVLDLVFVEEKIVTFEYFKWSITRDIHQLSLSLSIKLCVMMMMMMMMMRLNHYVMILLKISTLSLSQNGDDDDEIESLCYEISNFIKISTLSLSQKKRRKKHYHLRALATYKCAFSTIANSS